MKSWVIQIVAALGLVLLVGLALGGVKVLQFGAMAEAGESMVMPPAAVTTARAEAVEWRRTIEAIGTVVASQGVTIASEVPGRVRTIHFESGQTVEAGQLLLSLDASSEWAQLASARTGRQLADLEFTRAGRLRESGANSAAELDSAQARSRQATASVRSIRAVAGKKKIRAPFSGRLGIRQVNLGQVLDPGTPVVSLQALNPVFVDFAIPQQDIDRVAPGNRVEATAQGTAEEVHEGVLDTVDAQVNPRTRTVQIRARFENPDERLIPGAFVEVRVSLGETINTLAIPASSVLYAPYGDSVFVVRNEGDAMLVGQKFIRLGVRRGDLVAVESGLAEGDVVVSTGAFKLRNDMTVIERNDIAPPVDAAPTPDNE